MERMDQKGQMKLFIEIEGPKEPIERDTIGADEGGRCMDDQAVRNYVKIAGLDYVSSMIKGGKWRITEKGREYLQNMEKERRSEAEQRAEE